jgi:hypothetical protein
MNQENTTKENQIYTFQILNHLNEYYKLTHK